MSVKAEAMSPEAVAAKTVSPTTVSPGTVVDTASATLDLDFVRSNFPVFEDAEAANWAFFENAGGSYMAKQVIDKLNHYNTATRVQPYAGYGPSALAGQAMDESHTVLAEMLNVHPCEVILGPSTSINTYVLARAVLATLRPGDELIITNQDHEANIGAWWRLQDDGIKVKTWQVDPATGLLAEDDLAALLTDKTKLVAFTHCSNIAAQIQDVQSLTKLCYEAGARVVVDGVSYAPHGLPDVAELGVDAYLFSLYKTYGPHLGLMVVRDDFMQTLGHQGHYFNDPSVHPDKAARYRLTPAGPQHAQIACASGVADYLDTLYEHHFSEVVDRKARAQQVNTLFQAHEQRIIAPLVDYLVSHPDIRLIGPQTADHTKRAPTLAFTSQTHTSTDLAQYLLGYGVACNHGHFYAYRLMEALGLSVHEGVVRLSAVHYTSAEDVARVIEALEQIL
ncbi:MAG: aminotransferase class V-fold PLP-dependent enzyme [Deinococcota bacterium]